MLLVKIWICTLAMGKDRKWLGGTGRNIPSFEVFTSPDWRGTEGWIRFNQPLYRYGSMVKGIELEFKKGRVVKATAKENEKLLKEMLATDEGASQIGEYSLTDKRLSELLSLWPKHCLMKIWAANLAIPTWLSANLTMIPTLRGRRK
jgi:hypothetical protein